MFYPPSASAMNLGKAKIDITGSMVDPESHNDDS